MTLHIHQLKGCAPAPLAHYLKALGVLRLIVEQRADPDARGWWQDEAFFISSKLSREEIEKFFLETYEPTPLLSPWNKGCGFFKQDDPGLVPLENSKADRFDQFRQGIAESRELIGSVSNADAVIRAIKARTKRNSAFQTEQQRELLEKSTTVHECLELLQCQMARKDLAESRRDEISREIATINSLYSKAEERPTRSDVERVKASPGYKRLLAAAVRRFSSLKAGLIPNCARNWRGAHADWLSAAVVLDEEGNPKWPSILGTGGNDGNLDFTNNFMQRIGELFDLKSANGEPHQGTGELLAGSLWSEPSMRLSRTAIGQFQPGAAGGANSSTGPGGDSLVNGWDFLLMLEGTIIFRSSATRRLDPDAFTRASSPFVVHAQSAGFVTPGLEKNQRNEQWMPLWARPSTLAEITALFGEARIQLNRRVANSPIDAALAICRLGGARGILAFTRFGYLERNGQSNLAVPLGRISVPNRQVPYSHLIDDLRPWMDRLQRKAREAHAPARLTLIERQLADSVFAVVTQNDSPSRWQNVLRTAVAIEALQATGTAFEVGPIPSLHPEWVNAVDDSSPEVRLALALGSAAAVYSKEGRSYDSIRHHWLPLEPGAVRFQVSDRRILHDSRVVMVGRDPVADCAAVVDRRIIEAGMKGRRNLPLMSAKNCGANLSDLAKLVAGTIDLSKVTDLAKAFMAIRWRSWSPEYQPQYLRNSETPDEAWLAIRLVFLPWPLSREKRIPAEPSILRRLMSGDSATAVCVAIARLRAAGIRTPLRAGAAVDAVTARRWAAALAFPINFGTALRAASILDPSLKGTPHA